MAFRYVQNLSGGDPVILAFPLAAVTTVRDSICYYNAAGFLTNAYAAATDVTTNNIAGVMAEAVVNAAGAAGDLNQPFIATRDALYVADTTGAVERTDIGTSVTLDSILVADEDDPVTGLTGTVRMLNVVGTAGTATQALVSLNFASPTEA